MSANGTESVSLDQLKNTIDKVVKYTDVESELNSTSEKPVQNKVVTEQIEELSNNVFDKTKNEIKIYGKTEKTNGFLNSIGQLPESEQSYNLWMEMEGEHNGVTYTTNDDGSITLSGTATGGRASINSDINYSLKPSTEYTLSIDNAVSGMVEHYGFILIEKDVNNDTIDEHNIGYEGRLERTFTTSPFLNYSIQEFSVANGESISGTYHVILNECSEPLTWEKPGYLSKIDIQVDNVTTTINMLGNLLCSLPSGIRDVLTINEDNSVEILKKCGYIAGYNNEDIQTEYISSSDTLTFGDQVVYALEQPTIIKLPPTDIDVNTLFNAELLQLVPNTSGVSSTDIEKNHPTFIENHVHSASDIVEGVLPIELGGTGANSAGNANYNIFKNINLSGSSFYDGVRIVYEDPDPDPNVGVLRTKGVTILYDYIKEKIAGETGATQGYVLTNDGNNGFTWAENSSNLTVASDEDFKAYMGIG